ncbi:glycosyltransferase family 2 protein [Sediminibacterium roseum]|uniref:Glycosyltransferase family 2 protein n=1 Tax=Sediminibacterium roseum TaxID=1978412 RepID=A0ABW9ZWX3_9BACT|nr:glycosyltransferase family 2 protein [Sediminibacterium roseum]NCI51656.1 glycosyltransferase family 2 protein [Sediminibacterium roseum]
MPQTLYIILPAYNESANIESVVAQWHPVVEKIGGNSRLLIIDDGSKDDTYSKMLELGKRYPYLEAITKPNSGHGRTLLFGYNLALERNADWIFQTDSDGHTDPNEFQAFWENRNEYDFLIGVRNNRQDGSSRVFVTKVLKLVLLATFGVSVPDANTPFRLINAATLRKYLGLIPADSFLSNVVMSTLIVKDKVPVKWIPITFKPRQAGKNSINLKSITKIGLKAIRDFRQIKKSYERSKRP